MSRPPHISGRLILIVDEIAPGQYATDLSSDMHPAKVSMIALHLFRNASHAVDDDLQRREILNKADEVMKIVTGEKKQPDAPLFTEPNLPENLQ